MALACTAVLASSAPASAGVDDGPGATLSTVTDIAAASLDNVGQPNDNIACDVPKAGGGVVNQRTGYFVGEVYGNDAGFGEIACARIDGGSFTLNGVAYIQAYSAGTWSNVRTGPASSLPSVGGASAVAPTVLGSYAAMDSALNKYHRTMVRFTTSTGRTYTMYSVPWFMSA